MWTTHSTGFNGTTFHYLGTGFHLCQDALMDKKTPRRARREESLSKERIIEAAIDILDRTGESGLTFRALSDMLATGPGAIYWHIDNKNDLLTAACDAIVARTVQAGAAGAAPKDAIRALALDLFDAMEAHPWAGSALIRAGGQLPVVRVLECLGRQVQALGVPPQAQWLTVSALLHFILGVGGQNAANMQRVCGDGVARGDLLDQVAADWSRLSPVDYPFARSMAGQLRIHDDRADFLAGVDLILNGIGVIAAQA
ncbi:TetR/AcrR family transcriptional regulator [Massilia antarctica]|uniref:TetR/AcrR family transcriptional regulator n=1 Tax=Massilia antarctica TaxID=2765360 RepID=UPI00226FEBE2|nr:TetR family transcriptional regulator [Massilia sp. H27-R4]MCY0915118.1 TetR family transcriptional regulator [Massilia sp. H27-R4]